MREIAGCKATKSQEIVEQINEDENIEIEMGDDDEIITAVINITEENRK